MHATEIYERHGSATRSLRNAFLSGLKQEFAAALEKTSQAHLEQLAVNIGSAPQFELSSRPSARFHGDVVACMGDVKSQLASGGKVFLTAASTGELERFADICREYEVPYVLGESENAAAGFTAEGALETAGLLLIRAPFARRRRRFPTPSSRFLAMPICSMLLRLSSGPVRKFAPPDSSAISPS